MLLNTDYPIFRPWDRTATNTTRRMCGLECAAEVVISNYEITGILVIPELQTVPTYFDNRAAGER